MHTRILNISRLLQTVFYGANVHCTIWLFFDIVELGIYASLFFETVFMMLKKKTEDPYRTIKGMHCHSKFRADDL
jgi:hypothetical protein